MTNKEAIRILRDSAETASIFEIAEAVDLAIEALKEAGRYELVSVKEEGRNRPKTVLKDNGTQCYYLQYVTIAAARDLFGIIELKEGQRGEAE